METKEYQYIENDGLMANEPEVAYGMTTERVAYSVDGNSEKEDTEDLPQDVLRMAIECALDDIKNGRTIPADKIMDALHERLGWK